MEVAALNLRSQSRTFKGMDDFAFSRNNASNGIIKSPSFFNDIQDVINRRYLGYTGYFERDKALEEDMPLKEYKGFRLVELAETTVEYQKKYQKNVGFIAIRPFRTLFLEKYAHNEYYPEQYLVISPELELEGIGGTKEDALSDIRELFDIYYTEVARITSDINDFIDFIETTINTMKPWKQEFYRLFGDGLNSEKFPLGRYRHKISIRK